MKDIKLINRLNPDDLYRRITPREDDSRGSFFRDTTAIIHSYPFRRLKHKTQVFFSPKNDHICTRIEHVMHVASIASAICKGLDLDSELAWAIGLGHDLGHTPFGHAGEKIIDALRKNENGFIHELYSLRIVDYLIQYGRGLNLTYAVRDGIVSHCGEKFEQSIGPDFRGRELRKLKGRTHYPSTWEGAVVRMADKIAYLGRDIEDAIQLRLIKVGDIPEAGSRVVGTTNSMIISNLTDDIIRQSLKTGEIGFSDEIYEALLILRDFNYRNIYYHPILLGHNQYFERILKLLFSYLNEVFDKYGDDLESYSKENNLLAVRFSDYLGKMSDFYTTVDGSFNNLVTDYIAGMTDDYAIECVAQIMMPDQMEFQFKQFLMVN
ncbi:MAG: HD domain-containing protein [Spirochaetales bacterium]|nr:HD domain-containing protein [Spirochaetales bacterium]